MDIKKIEEEKIEYDNRRKIFCETIYKIQKIAMLKENEIYSFGYDCIINNNHWTSFLIKKYYGEDRNFLIDQIKILIENIKSYIREDPKFIFLSIDEDRKIDLDLIPKELESMKVGLLNLIKTYSDDQIFNDEINNIIKDIDDNFAMPTPTILKINPIISPITLLTSTESYKNCLVSLRNSS